jgi:hypothetical protein
MMMMFFLSSSSREIERKREREFIRNHTPMCVSVALVSHPAAGAVVCRDKKERRSFKDGGGRAAPLFHLLLVLFT